MLSISSISPIRDSYNKNSFPTKSLQFKQQLNASNVNYADKVDFCAKLPQKTTLEILPDLKLAIKNSLTGVYNKKTKRGSTIKTKVVNGVKTSSTTLNKKGGKTVKFYKNGELASIKKKFKNGNQTIITYIEKNPVYVVDKNKQGKITWEARNFFDEKGKLVSSMARDHIAKKNLSYSFNHLDECNYINIIHDNGLSINHKFEKETLVELTKNIPNGTSITIKYYPDTGTKKAVIEQCCDLTQIKNYSPDNKLESSVIDYDKKTLKVCSFDKDQNPIHGNFIFEDGSDYGIYFIDKGKGFNLFDNNSGEIIDTPMELIEWFNDIEAGQHSIAKLTNSTSLKFVDWFNYNPATEKQDILKFKGKLNEFTDPIDVIKKHTGIIDAHETFEKDINVKKPNISLKELLPIKAELKNLRSN